MECKVVRDAAIPLVAPPSGHLPFCRSGEGVRARHLHACAPDRSTDKEAVNALVTTGLGIASCPRPRTPISRKGSCATNADRAGPVRSPAIDKAVLYRSDRVLVEFRHVGVACNELGFAATTFELAVELKYLRLTFCDVEVGAQVA
eukprot:4391775-Prymnesium_polylepis.1